MAENDNVILYSSGCEDEGAGSGKGKPGAQGGRAGADLRQGSMEQLATGHSSFHRWALSPISVISDIGLSLISELPISD